MKTISAALKAHLSQGMTTCAYLWKVKRADGTILGFTGHDRDVVYDALDGDGAVTYLASTGFTNTASSSKSDFSPDNLEVTAFLESSSITEADLRAHLYDYAVISIRLVNWKDLTQGDLLIRVGTLGIVKNKNGVATAEIRGLTHKLSTVVGRTYGPLCRAQFGSGKNGIGTDDHWLCLVDVTAFQQNGSVSTVVDSMHMVPAAGLLMVGSATPSAPAPAGWFDDGLLTFNSGAADDLMFEIKSWDGTTLAMYLPFDYMPAPGDTFTIEPGCNHTPFDCQNKFVNIVNYQGEPFQPGQDRILDYPNAS